jgi:hypothetical protein
MKYDLCPRCGGEWADEILPQPEGHTVQYCTQCNMVQNCYVGKYGYGVDVGPYDVIWWYDRYPNEQCSIYPSSPPRNSHLILETTLPFTVTEEMIRMLLVFS